VENKDHALKPGMFVSAVVRAALASDGRAAPTGVEGKFSCPMHPQVLREEPGQCPICEMRLEQIPGLEPAAPAHPAHASQTPAAEEYACPMRCEGARTYSEPGSCPVCGMQLEGVAPPGPSALPGLLSVPATAVLDSGTRRIVYVERSRGLFEPREVVLGPRTGAFFPVLAGLAEGEHVVTRGGFLIDSQFQITGHPSLFYPGGLMAGATGHQHGGPAAPDSPPPSAAPTTPSGGPGRHEH
jgi:Cu(I)/Ag(I) efflux system membrane fusion protein